MMWRSTPAAPTRATQAQTPRMIVTDLDVSVSGPEDLAEYAD